MPNQQAPSRGFWLHSREEVEAFASRLYENQLVKMGYPPKPIPPGKAELVRVYDQLRQLRPDDWGKLFAAFLDLEINFHLLQVEMIEAGRIWTTSANRRQERGSILDSLEKFSAKMELHRNLSSFVMRYRAAWDKAMGILVLLLAPDRYEKFDGADSKKGAFEKIMADVPAFPNTQAIVELLKSFDNSYRTAEAHGNGRLRKFTFLMMPTSDCPLDPSQPNVVVQLSAYYNALGRMRANLLAAVASLSGVVPEEKAGGECS